MVENSVYLSLDKASMYAELKMQLASPKNKNKVFIILEGQDDITLLKDCFTQDCYLFESYGGKQALEETVRLFEYNNVIGIRDRDYTKSCNPRIFFCDYCNAEMMVVSNNEAFNSLLKKLTQTNDDFVELKNKLLNDLAFISAIRKLNEENGYGLCFKRVSINHLCKSQNLSNLSYLINYINHSNDKKINDDKKHLIQAEVVKIKDNLLMYTNGHDFCELLITTLKKTYPKNNAVKTLSTDNFHVVLYIGYHYIYFFNTMLYNKLHTYQLKNNLNIVRKNYVNYMN